MKVKPLEPSILREAATRGLGEDRGPADMTSLAVVDAEVTTRARIFSKEPCILCGLPLAQRVFEEVDIRLELNTQAEDSDELAPGQTAIEIHGATRSILTGERTALNFLQHLSGIATETARYVAATEGSRTEILDTRKTLPGLRALQKYAVRCGGGTNHRMGLYDAFMVKDNHLAALPPDQAIDIAVKRARDYDPDLPLVMEADTLEQVDQLLALEVDHILLDNMSNEEMAEAVQRANGKCKLEASGNMSLERIPGVSATGVDYISVGALTHSVQAIDFSLELLD